MTQKATEDYRMVTVGPEWFDDVVPCRKACPARTDVPRYIASILEGSFEEAYETNCAANVFPGVLGRVCVKFCEEKCRRAQIDGAVSICALKRAAADHRPAGRRRLFREDEPWPRPERVAVVGSGPGGLTVAHDLALCGYRVVVFEALPVAGGMLNVGLPPYRLPREIVQTEVIQPLQDLGVEIRVNTGLGTHFTLSDLTSDGFDAIVLAVGCVRSRDLEIEGADLDGVLRGVDFLFNANLGRGVRLGERVLVIGGGNVAIDVARTAIRVGEETPFGERIILATDVARSALRLGAREVHIVCLEKREEMPAYESEIRGAEEEGIQFHTARAPKRIIGGNGRVSGLETLEVSSVFDEQGRFNPTVVQDTEQIVHGDTVVLAIGQRADLSFLTPDDALKTTPAGLLDADSATGRTNVDRIFGVGDVVVGPQNIIEVIADAHRVADAVRAFLERSAPKRRADWLVSAVEPTADVEYDRMPRVPTRVVAAEERRGHLGEVDLGFSAQQALEEARRCLQCDRNIFISPDRCVLCGACVEVCPYECIRMIPVEQIESDGGIGELATATSWPEGSTAMVLDETLCIRCGICVRRCPADAIRMEHFALAHAEENGNE